MKKSGSKLPHSQRGCAVQRYSLERSQRGVEVGDGFDAGEVIFEGDVFVGGVGVFVGEAEAEEDAGDFEGVVHLGDEGDGAAFADEDGFFAKAFFESRLRGFENGRVERRDPGLAFAEDIEFAMDGFGKELANVLFDEVGDFLRILVGDEASGEFGVGLGGDDGLGAFALVAAPEAVEFESGANPELLDGGETFFAGIAGSANGLLESFLFPRQSVERFAFGFGGGGNVVVETGNGDAEIFVVQLGEQFSENGERVGDRAAVDARVQVADGAGQFDLVIVETAQTIGDGGDTFSEHGSVRNDERIGFQLLLIFLNKIPEADAADFFFAFDEDFNVNRQISV